MCELSCNLSDYHHHTPHLFISKTKKELLPNAIKITQIHTKYHTFDQMFCKIGWFSLIFAVFPCFLYYFNIGFHIKMHIGAPMGGFTVKIVKQFLQGLLLCFWFWFVFWFCAECFCSRDILVIVGADTFVNTFRNNKMMNKRYPDWIVL